MQPLPSAKEGLALSELLDRILYKGVVLWGDATISVAGIDLVYVGIKLLLTSVDKGETLRADALQALPVRTEAAE
ncbi:MAG: gas vesicle protein [Devosia sp.]|nr:gas vesicle protein [Devosia sp.]